MSTPLPTHSPTLTPFYPPYRPSHTLLPTLSPPLTPFYPPSQPFIHLLLPTLLTTLTSPLTSSPTLPYQPSHLLLPPLLPLTPPLTFPSFSLHAGHLLTNITSLHHELQCDRTIAMAAAAELSRQYTVRTEQLERQVTCPPPAYLIYIPPAAYFIYIIYIPSSLFHNPSSGLSYASPSLLHVYITFSSLLSHPYPL